MNRMGEALRYDERPYDETPVRTRDLPATPVRDRHARRREQTRSKLVEAARTLFARHGVDNTRTGVAT